MPRNVSKDRSGEHVDAAARKTTAQGSGTGVFRPVSFRPGEREVYSNRGKKK